MLTTIFCSFGSLRSCGSASAESRQDLILVLVEERAMTHLQSKFGRLTTRRQRPHKEAQRIRVVNLKLLTRVHFLRPAHRAGRRCISCSSVPSGRRGEAALADAVAARRAEDQHVRRRDRHLFADAAALRVHAVRLRVLVHPGDTFDHDLVLLRPGREGPSRPCPCPRR